MAYLTTIAVVVAVVFFIYRFVIYPAFISPLARIPNAHWTSPFSAAWIMHKRLNFAENRAVYTAHDRHGQVVRLGPKDVHINCVDDGLRTVYGGGFEKHEWYHLFANYDAVPTMFSTVEGRPHSLRKRMMSNVFAKSTIQSSEGFAIASQRIVNARLLPFLRSRAISEGKPVSGSVDLYQMFNYATMDFVTAYMFGLSSASNFLGDSAAADEWLGLYQSRKKYVFWPQEHPRLTSLLSRLGIRLSPRWVAEANRRLEEWCMRMCDAAEACVDTKRPEDVPSVYRQYRESIRAEEVRQAKGEGGNEIGLLGEWRVDVASEMLDQLSAGHETSAITLSFLFYELCRDQELQDALRAELRAGLPQLVAAAAAGEATPCLELPSAKALDALPLLHAALLETMRLHPAIPGPQPRVTPGLPGGVRLGAFDGIPGGVRVAASPYSLHRNPTVFPDPLAFRPQRWLSPEEGGRDPEERLRERRRWFWAFGSGGRMCVGSNLAMQQMKTLAAALLANYRFVAVLDAGSGDDVLRQEDSYTAQPVGQRLVVCFEAA